MQMTDPRLSLISSSQDQVIVHFCSVLYFILFVHLILLSGIDFNRFSLRSKQPGAKSPETEICYSRISFLIIILLNICLPAYGSSGNAKSWIAFGVHGINQEHV